MASIQKRTETVTSSFYRLDLTEEEARVLYVVLGRVGGESTGYCGVSAGIFHTLAREIKGMAISLPEHEDLTGFLRFSERRS